MIDLPIVRLYRSAQHAERAHAAMRRWGFEPERILRIEAGYSTREDRIAALRAASIPEWRASQYADAIADGCVLLVVCAPFGTGGHAEQMLAEGEPIALATAPIRPHLLPSDLAAPLSRTLGVPTLARRGRTTSETLGLPSLVRSGRTTSEALGLPTLARTRPFVLDERRSSDNAAPFSRLLHLPVLIRDRIAGRAHPPRVMRREIGRGDSSPSAAATGAAVPPAHAQAWPPRAVDTAPRPATADDPALRDRAS